jgi:hypothetical protein
MRLITLCSATLLLLAAAAVPAGSQIVSLDEGSLTLVRDGARLGREDFSIRSAPGTASGGVVLVAQGNMIAGTRRFVTGLNADTAGFPLRYQTDLRVDGRAVESYSGLTTRDHYASRANRENGESAREFRLPVGTVLAEDNVLHQLWFVARRGHGAVVPVLVPGRNVVEMVKVELVGTEKLTLEAREFDARHFRLTAASSGTARDVWLDPAGRLLKVVVPSLKLVAVREETLR